METVKLLLLCRKEKICSISISVLSLERKKYILHSASHVDHAEFFCSLVTKEDVKHHVLRTNILKAEGLDNLHP